MALVNELSTFYAHFKAAANISYSGLNSARNSHCTYSHMYEECVRAGNTFIISGHEETMAFGRMNITKAAGPDNISDWGLKASADQLALVFSAYSASPWHSQKFPYVSKTVLYCSCPKEPPVCLPS